MVVVVVLTEALVSVGNNYDGQLATNQGRLQPLAQGIASAQSISCSYSRGMLQSNGSIQSWGSNVEFVFDGLYGATSSGVYDEVYGNVPTHFFDSSSNLFCAGAGHTSLVDNQGSVLNLGILDNSSAYISNVTQLKCGMWSTFAIDSNSNLYSWSSKNKNGIQGSGNTNVSTAPRLVMQNVSSVAISNHALAVTNRGDLYGWGMNFWCQLGVGNCMTAESASVPTPQRVNISNVSQVAVGIIHSLALLENGSVMCWGRNAARQCGPSQSEVIQFPALINVTFDVNGASKKVVRLFAGDVQSVALLEDGTLFTWGGNSAFQLGNGSSASEGYNIVPILNEYITDVCVGAEFVIALSDSNRVFAWGNNQHGQCGNAYKSPLYERKHNFVSNYNLVSNYDLETLSLGRSHGVVASKDRKRLFSWGSNAVGEGALERNYLATTPTVSSLISLETVADQDTIKLVCAGDDYTAIVIQNATRSRVLTVGTNDAYVRGFGNAPLTDFFKPFLAHTGNVTHVSCKSGHILVANDASRVYGWGRNTLQQVLDTTQNEVAESTFVYQSNSPIVQLEASQFMSAIVMQDGSARFWGNNSGRAFFLSNVSQITIIEYDYLTLYFNSTVWQWSTKRFVLSNCSHIEGKSSFFATCNGSLVYGWGKNSKGELGLGHSNVVSVPTLINNASRVYAGNGFSMMDTGDSLDSSFLDNSLDISLDISLGSLLDISSSSVQNIDSLDSTESQNTQSTTIKSTKITHTNNALYWLFFLIVPFVATLCASVLLIFVLVITIIVLARKRSKLSRSLTHHLELATTNPTLSPILKSEMFSSCESSSQIDPNLIKYEKLIGKGTCGNVYRALWRQQTVAVKQVDVHEDTPREVIDQMMREVNLLSKLRHPGIVAMYGFSYFEKFLLVMEHATLGSLTSSLANASLNRVDIALQIATALLYLHSQKVLHRDLKSLNVLLDGETCKSARAKICDFGLSTKSKSGFGTTLKTQGVGSPLWMAPEVTRGEEYTFSADVYSFGILLWEIVFGKVPYQEHSHSGNVHIRASIEETFRPLVDLKCALVSEPRVICLMQKCWSHTPQHRPLLEDVVKELRAIKKL